MAIRGVAIDPRRTIDFVPENQPQEDGPTVFKIRPLTSTELAAIYDLGDVDENGWIKLSLTMLAEAAKKGLSGWDNMLDDNGEPLAFSRNIQANLTWISSKYLFDIGGEVMRISRVAQKTEKN